MRRTPAALASAAALGVALAASCGSSSSAGSGNQSVAWSAPITAPHGAAHGPDGALTPLAAPHPAPQVAATGYDWQNVRTNNYMRDPSDGGAGTPVLISAFTSSNSEDWVPQANGHCGGTVTSSCPGGWISANLRGFQIVTVRNIGQGSLCEGVSASTNWHATMRTCDGVNGITNTSTLFAYGTEACPGSTARVTFTSWTWNASFTDQGALFDPEQGNNDNLTAGDNSLHCFALLWKFATSVKSGGSTLAASAQSADQPPECNPLRLITPAGKSIWLQACGSGPSRESQVQDWTPGSLARQTAVMDGVAALTPANCPRSAPCVLIGASTPPS